MYPQFNRLNVPTWIIGPALGEGPLIDRPADVLKVWPTRELIQRLPPAHSIRFSISLLQGIVVNPVADRGSGFVSRLARPNAVNAATGTGHYVLRSLDGDALAKNGAEDFHFRIA